MQKYSDRWGLPRPVTTSSSSFSLKCFFNNWIGTISLRPLESELNWSVVPRLNRHFIYKSTYSCLLFSLNFFWSPPSHSGSSIVWPKTSELTTKNWSSEKDLNSAKNKVAQPKTPSILLSRVHFSDVCRSGSTDSKSARVSGRSRI